MKSTLFPLVLLATLGIGAAPQMQSIPLVRKRAGMPLSKRAGFEHVEALERGIRRVYGKYGMTAPPLEGLGTSEEALRKRAGFVQLADVTGDIQYYGSIQIGTPPINYQVIMDTGSSDLIIATSPCTGCASTTPLYSSRISTTGESSTTPFDITYGTGAAQGRLARDTVSIAGYTQRAQVFAATTNLSNIVDGDLSGLLGLGFATIASSGAVPIVQALARAGLLESPEFGFAFARWNTNPIAFDTIQPGGILTIGGVNATLYSGPINYIPLVDAGSYWLIPLTDIKIGGVSTGVNFPSTIIDTGTSLIGMPRAAVEAIYSRIPGSAPFGAQGLYSFPCTASVSLSFTFGGIEYPMRSTDFNNGATSSSGRTCVGAIFALESQGGRDLVIVGDAFLKNVYNTYRFTPPAVGFATLANPGNVLQSGFVPKSNGTLASGAQANVGQSGSSLPGGSSSPVAPANGTSGGSTSTGTARPASAATTYGVPLLASLASLAFAFGW